MRFKDAWNKEALKAWFVAHAESKKGVWALALISFFEAIIFPIPPDFFLAAVLAATKGKRWAYYSAITSVASVLGGLTSYAIGYLFFESLGRQIIDAYHIGGSFETAQQLFRDNAFWAVLVAAATPLPDKLFNLVAGLFRVDPLIFLSAYVLARTARFFLVGAVMKLFGVRVARVLYKHLNIVSIALLVIIIIAFVVILIV